ncbi:hypothetical protein BSPWISOXPB_6969 [uncultured Gammaproteobacteria bacterium]|nr:hypothetical protein BSPWISOXPB_6969 [uncultured Gammaproteobacteria bacterium]
MALNGRTYVKEVKNCPLIRHFRHVKKRAKAKKALTRLRPLLTTHQRIATQTSHTQPV